MKENSFQDEFRGTDAELVRQLVRLRQTPSAALRRRVEDIPQQAAPRGGFVPRLAWIAVVLVAIGLVLNVPAVRAMLDPLEEVIGRIHLIVTDLNPYRDEPVTTVEGEAMSLEEAREKVSFDFALPQGFTANEVTVYTFGGTPDFVEVDLCNVSSLCLELLASAYSETGSTLVGPESVETIQVNGQEAVVFSGGWDADSGTWIEDVGQTTIIWEAGGVQYELMAVTEVASLEELIAIAESVP